MAEERFEEYDPWMNGDASYLDGKYFMMNGWTVVIDSRCSHIAADDDYGVTRFSMMGGEADDLIKKIAWQWSTTECNKRVAVEDVVFEYAGG